jgi:hypothetical protein
MNEFIAMRTALLNGPLGEDIIVDGTAVRGLIHRNIELIGEYGQVVGRRTEFELPCGAGVLGAAILLAEQPFVIDAKITDDGLFERWAIRSDQ